MVNSADRKTAEQADRKAQEKARRRAEQAAIVTALQQILEGDENLLGFARGRIAGGWRGKLNVGPEAFLAPFINIGLTDRRILLQHIHPESGKPSEILPHSFLVTDILDLSFSDIETFGAEKACRLVLRLNTEQNFRIRLVGNSNVENAEAMTEVFRSLTDARRKTAPSPTHSSCPNCRSVLEQSSKFCPYCGHNLAVSAPVTAEPSVPAEPAAEPEVFAYAEASAVAEPEIFASAEPVAAAEPEVFATAEPYAVAEQIEMEAGIPLNEDLPPIVEMQEEDPTSVQTSEVQGEPQEQDVVETYFAADEAATDSFEEPTSEPLSDAIEAQNYGETPVVVAPEPEPAAVADTPPTQEGEL